MGTEKQEQGKRVIINAIGLPPMALHPDEPVLARIYDDSMPGYKGVERRFLGTKHQPARLLKKHDLLVYHRLLEVKPIQEVFIPAGPRSTPLGTLAFKGDILAMIGLYLSEGHYKSSSRYTQFTLHEDEFAQLAILRRWAESVNLTCYDYMDDSHARQVLIYSAALGEWLSSEFGQGARQKRLPDWFIFCHPDKQLRVWRWYYAGDGLKAQDSSRSALHVGTRSEQMARQWQDVLARLGYGASLCIVNDHDEPRYDISIGGRYGVELARRLGMDLPHKKRRFNHIRITDEHVCYPVRSVQLDELTRGREC